MWFLIFFLFTPWAQSLLHATQVSYLVIAPDLFVFFPLGQGLTKLPGVLLLWSSPPSGSDVAGITGPHCHPAWPQCLDSQRT